MELYHERSVSMQRPQIPMAELGKVSHLRYILVRVVVSRDGYKTLYLCSVLASRVSFQAQLCSATHASVFRYNHKSKVSKQAEDLGVLC